MRAGGRQIGSLRTWSVCILTNTQTRKQKFPTSLMAGGGGGGVGAEEDEQKFRQRCPACGGRQAVTASASQRVNGLWCPPPPPPPSPTPPRDAPLHYPKMVKSISFNYIKQAEISSFYGNKCESLRTPACQVLNIAVRVMCHCQTDHQRLRNRRVSPPCGQLEMAK